MNDSQDTPTTSTTATATTTTPQQPKSSYWNTRKVWGICLIAGPTAVILVSIFLSGIINLVVGETMPSCINSPDTMCGVEESMIAGAVRSSVFAITLISLFAWLPALIVGIVLLAKKPAKQAS